MGQPKLATKPGLSRLVVVVFFLCLCEKRCFSYFVPELGLWRLLLGSGRVECYIHLRGKHFIRKDKKRKSGKTRLALFLLAFVCWLIYDHVICAKYIVFFPPL